MKKIVLTLLIVVLIAILLIGSFLIKNNSNNSLVQEGTGGLVGYVKDDTLTSTGLTLVIEDKDNLVDVFSKTYTIKKMEEDNYVEVSKINDFAEENELYYASEEGIIELDLDWTNIYGELSLGKYLLIYVVKDYSFELEFVIE